MPPAAVFGANSTRAEAAGAANVHAMAPVTNPLLTGADPYVVRHGGYNYFLQVGGDSRLITMARSRSRLGAVKADPVVVADGGYDGALWEPKLFFFGSVPVLYASRGTRIKANLHADVAPRHVAALVGDHPDPMVARYTETRAAVTTQVENPLFNIDGAVFRSASHGNFLMWSGHPAGSVDHQYLYLARLDPDDPTRTVGEARRIAVGEQEWELAHDRKEDLELHSGIVQASGDPRWVLEAPVQGPDVVLDGTAYSFVTYAAGGTWARYCVGALVLPVGADPMTADFIKLARPVAWSDDPAYPGFGHVSPLALDGEIYLCGHRVPRSGEHRGRQICVVGPARGTTIDTFGFGALQPAVNWPTSDLDLLRGERAEQSGRGALGLPRTPVSRVAPRTLMLPAGVSR